MELVRYIHLNPVRSGLVQNPREYPWSSHRCYLGLGRLRVVNASLVLELMGKETARARKAFKNFVFEGLGTGHREDLYEMVEQRYFLLCRRAQCPPLLFLLFPP